MGLQPKEKNRILKMEKGAEAPFQSVLLPSGSGS